MRLNNRSLLREDNAMLQIIAQGSANSGTFAELREDVLQNPPTRYLIFRTGPHEVGRIGGSFPYKVFGTDKIEDLLDLEVLKAGGEFNDTKSKSRLELRDLAERFIEGLSALERAELKKRMMVDYILG